MGLSGKWGNIPGRGPTSKMLQDYTNARKIQEIIGETVEISKFERGGKHVQSHHVIFLYHYFYVYVTEVFSGPEFHQPKNEIM